MGRSEAFGPRWHTRPAGGTCQRPLRTIESQGGTLIGWHCPRCGAAVGIAEAQRVALAEARAAQAKHDAVGAAAETLGLGRAATRALRRAAPRGDLGKADLRFVRSAFPDVALETEVGYLACLPPSAQEVIDA